MLYQTSYGLIATALNDVLPACFAFTLLISLLSRRPEPEDGDVSDEDSFTRSWFKRAEGAPGGSSTAHARRDLHQRNPLSRGSSDLDEMQQIEDVKSKV